MMVDIQKAVELLKNGKPVAFPTETVYGLGADAWNPDAIQRVFKVKGRPSDNPLIVHIGRRKMVDDFAAEVTESASRLMDACWPGPLTLIFKKKPDVLDLITAGLDTVAIRWPSHAMAQELIFRAGPLVAPSANKSGRPSPTKAEHVAEDFGEDFPIIFGGTTQIGLESTVLDASELPLRIYRPGYVDRDKIEQITGEKVLTHSSTNNEKEMRSPGTKYSHYAPDAAVRWLKNNEPLDQHNVLYLLHNSNTEDKANQIHYNQDYRQMATDLYDRFRYADHKKFQEVVIEPFDNKTLHENPITEALLNRISKAIGRS